MTLQEKAKITIASLEARDPRAELLLMFLLTTTGVPREECLRRIRICAETGEMPT